MFSFNAEGTSKKTADVFCAVSKSYEQSQLSSKFFAEVLIQCNANVLCVISGEKYKTCNRNHLQTIISKRKHPLKHKIVCLKLLSGMAYIVSRL